MDKANDNIDQNMLSRLNLSYRPRPRIPISRPDLVEDAGQRSQHTVQEIYTGRWRDPVSFIDRQLDARLPQPPLSKPYTIGLDVSENS